MPPFLSARWLDVAALTWRVDPGVVASVLPDGLEPELDGDAGLVSLVAFSFADSALAGVPVPFHGRFPEVNLRVYARRRGEPGVVFVRELVPRGLVAGVARAVFNEPYRRTPMRGGTTVEAGADGPERHVAHRFGPGLRNRLELWADTAAATPPEGSLERRLTHHTIGFGTGHGGGTLAYRVRHPVWPLYPVRRHVLDADLERLYGAAFGALAARPPDACTLAAGSPVTVALPTGLARFDAGRDARREERDPLAPTGRATVLYDADCGICTDVARAIRRLDRDAQVDLVAIGSAAGAHLLADLAPAERLERWHLVEADGTRRSGGDALPALLRLLPGLAPLALLPAACPPLTRAAYEAVARNRHRLGRALGRTACAVPGA